MLIEGLYVRSWGPVDAPALLYLHGGPGQSSYEFEQHQAALLSQRLRLITLDQRGVLRSDPLPPGGTLTLDDLVADCETVRARLGVDSWAVLGQSFGGMLALRYAVRHPDAVTKVAFENPSWDLDRTGKSLLSALLAHPVAAAHPELAAKAEQAGADARALWAVILETLGVLGDHRDEIYVPDETTRRHINEMLAAAPYTPEQWAQGVEHLTQLDRDPELFTPHTPLLSRVTQPALLIKGELDPIPSVGEVNDFARALPSAEVRIFEGCGHFVQAEQPQAYAELVVDFVRSR